MNAAFQRQLAFGQQAETAIVRWIMRRGSLVLPIYDIEYDTGKGPRLFGEGVQYVAPDLLVLNSHNDVLWIEAKHKSVFTWHRITGRWTTGIDINHYESYVGLQARINWPIWLLFLHRIETPHPRDTAVGCPSKCPTGLFGNTLTHLKAKENHRHRNWGKYGMVYWAHEELRLLASLREVEACER